MVSVSTSPDSSSEMETTVAHCLMSKNRRCGLSLDTTATSHNIKINLHHPQHSNTVCTSLGRISSVLKVCGYT